jgi:glucan phosphoethanolaminetransferase (alkaline phosphatase superfamily)
MFFILTTPYLIYTVQHFSAEVFAYHYVFKISMMMIFTSFALLLFQPKYVFGSAALFLALQIPFEIVNLILLKSYLKLDGMVAIFKTNVSEAVQFSSALIPYLVAVILLIGLYLALLLVSHSIQFSKREKRIVAYVGLFSFVVFALIFATYSSYKPSLKYGAKNTHTYVLRQYILKEYPFNFYYRLREYYVLNRRLAKYAVEKDSFRFGGTRIGVRDGEEVYVFVIGEGMRYANWHVNGYHRETSPLLDREPDLISFHNHFSTSTSTSMAIPLLITRDTPKNVELGYREKTVVSLFEEAGFTTYWISNQNVFDYMHHASEVDYMYDLTPQHKSDVAVLPQLEEVVADTLHNKKFIIINLRGNHTPPSHLPEEFNHFKPNIKDIHSLLKHDNKDLFVTHYDNQILLQDYVLGSVIELLKVRPRVSFLLFTSDHAVSLFDEGGTLFGYGSPELPDAEIHVPLFFWCSEEFVRENREKYDHLGERAGALSSTTNIFHTLGDLADIRGDYLDPQLSVCDEQFRVDSIRSVFYSGEERILHR